MVLLVPSMSVVPASRGRMVYRLKTHCHGEALARPFTYSTIAVTATRAANMGIKGQGFFLYHNGPKHQNRKARTRPMKMAGTGCNMEGLFPFSRSSFRLSLHCLSSPVIDCFSCSVISNFNFSSERTVCVFSYSFCTSLAWFSALLRRVFKSAASRRCCSFKDPIWFSSSFLVI